MTRRDEERTPKKDSFDSVAARFIRRRILASVAARLSTPGDATQTNTRENRVEKCANVNETHVLLLRKRDLVSRLDCQGTREHRDAWQRVPCVSPVGARRLLPLP